MSQGAFRIEVSDKNPQFDKELANLVDYLGSVPPTQRRTLDEIYSLLAKLAEKFHLKIISFEVKVTGFNE